MRANEQQRILKFHVQHELIGNHSFQITEKCHLSELRVHIADNSPLCLFENFHFQVEGRQIYDYHKEISEAFHGDTHITVVFDPYDYATSRHHEGRVREILANPLQWAIVNSRQTGWKNAQQDHEQPIVKLQQIFQNPWSLDSLTSQQKESEFSTMLGVSGFNPVSSCRKNQGDLFYILVKTPQQLEHHITANNQGFHVNLSTHTSFNPNPNPKYSSFLSLLDLLYHLSPIFKQNFTETIRKAKISQFQRIITTCKPLTRNYNWLKENNGWRRATHWKNDCFLRQKAMEPPFPVVKDWSMMFQFYRAAPAQSLLDRMNREKLRYKTYQQLLETAIDGVNHIFNGSLQPLNSPLPFSQQIFYYEYLLFYFLPTTHSKDQLALSLIEMLEFQGVNLINTVVIQYRGYKIAVKAFPNSLINQTSIIQSLSDLVLSSRVPVSDESCLLAMKKIAKQLHLQGQNIHMQQLGQNFRLVIHPNLRGLMGNDGKKFIFDCSYFLPRDLNFKENDQQHAYLRPEMMKFYDSFYKCSVAYNTMIGTSCRVIYSERIKVQEKKLNSVAKFAKQIATSLLVESFDDEFRKYLSDSKGISMCLHRYGLSCKYLGLIYQRAMEKKSPHVRVMIQRTILVRSLKHFLRQALRQTPLHAHRQLLKHILNAFFQSEGGQTIKISAQQQSQNNNTRKTKKKKGKQSEILFEISFSKKANSIGKYYLNPDQLWQELSKLSLAKYKHKLNSKTEIFKYECSKTAILRDISLSLGIQLQKKDYFYRQNRDPINEESIITMTPLIKMRLPQPKQLQDLINQADILANKYQLQEAFETYNRALQYLFISFNGVHEKLALINKRIAAIYYKVGDFDTALMSAMNSCQIYEALLGKDHVDTIETYFVIGVYQLARKKFNVAQYYMLKAISTARLTYSECYPQLLPMLLNLSTVYENQKKFPDAIVTLYSALSLASRVFGEKHMHYIIVIIALASLHYEIPDIQQAIKFQTKAVEMLQAQLGVDDERTIQAKAVCDGYKSLQNSKKVRELHDKEQKNFGCPPNGKTTLKAPMYDFKGSNDFIWKKNKKMKYFF